MNTAMFFDYHRNERLEAALESKQGFDFVYTFLIRRDRDCCKILN